MKFIYLYIIFSFIVFSSCNNSDKNIGQYELTPTTIDLKDFKHQELDFSAPEKIKNLKIDYVILDTGADYTMNSTNKVLVEGDYIFTLSKKRKEILIFNNLGKLLSTQKNTDLGLGGITDFQIINDEVIIWDGNKDKISVYDINSENKKFKFKYHILPHFEIESFWKLNSGSFLASTVSWNDPRMEDWLIKANFKLDRIEKSYYKRLGYDDEPYLLSSSYFHLYNKFITITHSTDNLTFLFDLEGNLKEVIEVKNGPNPPKEILKNLEDNSSELSSYFFINDYLYKDKNRFVGKMAQGLNHKKAFLADTLEKIVYIEKKPYSSVFSNTVGSHENKILTLLIPGQYNLIRTFDNIENTVLEALNKGKYVFCIIDMNHSL